MEAMDLSINKKNKSNAKPELLLQFPESKNDNKENIINNKKSRIYSCESCKYQSNRKFNIERHMTRIHKPRKQAKACCGIYYYHKDMYYQHVEKVHPNKRIKATVSRLKYKIFKSEATPDSIKLSEENAQHHAGDQLPVKKKILRRYTDCNNDVKGDFGNSSRRNCDATEVKVSFTDDNKQLTILNEKMLFEQLTIRMRDYLADIDFHKF